MFQMDSTQIEQRIKEIRENIGQTKYMIDLFSGSSDPVSIFYLFFHLDIFYLYSRILKYQNYIIRMFKIKGKC